LTIYYRHVGPTGLLRFYVLTILLFTFLPLTLFLLTLLLFLLSYFS